MKRKKQNTTNTERWMLSYADFITLLMIFFIVMYSISSVNTGKYKQLADSFKTAAGQTIIGKDTTTPINQQTSIIDLNNTGAAATVAAAETAAAAAALEHNTLITLKKKLDAYLDKNGLKDTVTTTIDDRGLVVSIEDTEFFDIGKAAIRPEASKRIIAIGKILKQVVNYMKVEGHTDNIPISNNEFASNWQLSTGRAANVTELLISAVGIPPDKIAAVGYGQYRPVASNSTEVGRAKNRSIDIIVIDSSLTKLENNKK